MTAKPKRSRKLPLLLRELAEVKDETLAFLHAGPDQCPGDFERNLARAAELRRDFTSFCEQSPHYANWRQAWSAWRAQAEREKSDEASRPAQKHAATETADSERASLITVDFASPVRANVPVPPPNWRRRMRYRAFSV